MDKSDRQTHFLEVYRQQLRRETDAMGYDRSKVITSSFEPQSRNNSAASRMIVAIAVVVLGLVNVQVS